MATRRNHTALSSSSSGKDTPMSDMTWSEGDLKDAHGCIEIDHGGDLVLQIQHESKNSTTSHRFRVNSSALIETSKYFHNLLQPSRFEEGTKIKEKHESLKKQFHDISKAPSGDLPVVAIQDLGRISAIKSAEGLLTDFLLVLHSKDTQGSPPVANLANLAIVADRFDALSQLRAYVSRRKVIHAIDGKTTPKLEAALTEEKVRQRLLAGLLLDYPRWVERYSAHLINKGWVGKEADLDAALWWDLPMHVEDELCFRRDRVLETFQSLQSQLLRAYMSRERQCKLGYDSSTQCDSFQLGEAVRFFSRIGLLNLQSTLLDSANANHIYEGDLSSLIESLKQVPEYQIDKFHAHCGIRTRMIPALGNIEVALRFVGLSSATWEKEWPQLAWSQTHRPLSWEWQDRIHPFLRDAQLARQMFTAVERQWNW